MDSTSSIRPLPRQSGSRAAIERSQLREQYDRELDLIAAEFHARLPREKAQAVGAVYARYSSRDQHSIADQVRSLFEYALAQQIFIPREFVCFDAAIRGIKDRRPGLDQLRSILTARDVNVLLVFTTNRLFRKTYKALQFVEEQVVERGIRGIFVKSGVDTADKNRWRMMLQFHATMDEAVVGMYADNVRAAHEGLFANGLVCSTISFGYLGREVPGQKNKRQQPRRTLAIDPQAAPWVEQAFRWFGEDRLSIGEITRRFNDDPRIPRSPRSANGLWSQRSIHYLLENSRYRGWWTYGAAENIWQSQKDYARRVPREQPLKAAQFENLRIVSDALWYQAQRRLNEVDRSAVGRKPRSGDPGSRPRLIHGLFVCPTHDQILYVGGSYGQSLYCRSCQELPADKRPLYSLLPRALALKLTCRTLADLVRQDSQLVAAVIEACRRHAEDLQRPDPDRLQGLRSRTEALRRQIDFILSNSGETETDRQESAVRLRELRRQRADFEAEITTLQAALTQPAIVPSEAEVREDLAQLAAILTSAGIQETGAEGARVRQIIDLLTGGRIELVQCGETKAKRGWLQGRFRIRLLDGLVERLSGTAPREAQQEPLITIDYREPTPSEACADRVKELYDQGKLIKAIAAELDITRNRAAKALDSWYEQRGLAKPDGRTRRSTLDQKHLGPPLYMQLAEEAMRLYSAGHLLEEIATRLNCCRPTITRAIKHWHESHDLSAPDGRARREELDRRRPGSESDDSRHRDTSPSAA
jgi:site-specific DNA recombinase